MFYEIITLINGYTEPMQFPFQDFPDMLYGRYPRNCKLDIAGRYIRLPYHNQEGHKTLGNFYTTLLNAYGNPVEHYGAHDLSLKIDQSGAIKDFLI